MKISKDLKKLTTTQTELARALGLTQPRIHQLIQEGIVERDDHGAVLVIASLQNYYRTQTGEQTAMNWIIWKRKQNTRKSSVRLQNSSWP